jgi:hypothetical protein
MPESRRREPWLTRAVHAVYGEVNDWAFNAFEGSISASAETRHINENEWPYFIKTGIFSE